jgi:hypothetical protein
MRASVTEREKFTAKVENDDGPTADIDQFARSRRNVTDHRNNVSCHHDSPYSALALPE